MSSLVNKMAKGSLFIFISKIMEAVVALVFSIILARLLGKDLYGLIASTIGVAAVIGLFAKLGITEASAKFISEHLAKEERAKLKNVIYSTALLEVTLGAITAIICFIFAEPLATMVFHKPQLVTTLKIIAGMIFLVALTNIFTGIFLGYYKMELFAIANISGNITRLIVSITLVWLGYGLLGAVTGFVVGAAVNSLLGLSLYLVSVHPTLSKTKMKSISVKPEIKKLIGFGIPIIITAGMMIIYQWTDTLCLTAFTEVRYISWYNIAFGMVAMTLIFSQTLNTSFFPIVSELHAKKKAKSIRMAYISLTKLLAHLMNILIISMMALAPQIIVLLYGTDYLPALIPFLILALWGLIRPYNVLSGAIPIGMGKPQINAKVAVVTAASNLGLNLTLIPFFGMLGAAVATTISYLVGTFAMVIITLNLIKSKFPWHGILKSLLGALLAGLSMFLVMRFLLNLALITGNLGLIIYLIISFSIGLIIYLTVLYLTKSFEKTDVKILKELNIPMKNQLLNIIKRLSR
ncbi:flippase [[Eubacterium] cellulosolvens]